MKRVVVAGLLALAFVLFSALPAFAHAELESSDPAPSARYPSGQPPATMTLQFSESVQIPDDAIRVFDGTGTEIPGVGEPAPGDSDSTVGATLPALDDGSYIASWRVVSVDAHPISGSVTFTVGEGAAADAGVVASLETHGSRVVGILFGFARALTFAGVLLLVGIVAFVRLCWPDGAQDRGTRRLLWGAWIATLFGAIASIGLQAAYVYAKPLSAAFDLSLVGDVLEERFGRAALARIVLLAFAILLVRAPGRKLLGGNFDIVLGIGLVATLTASGHAGTGRWIPFGIATDLVHLLSAAVWLGGVTMLAAALLAPAPPEGILDAGCRFSRVAAPAIAIVAITGTMQALRQIVIWDDALDLAYVRLVLAKAIVLVFIVTAASVSRYLVHKWQQDAPDPTEVRDLRNAVLVEVAFAAVILAFTAVLVNTEPPKTEAAETTVVGATPYSATLTDAELTFEITVSPAGDGENTLTVQLLDAQNAPFDSEEATATFENSALGIAPIDVELTRDDVGSYRGTAALLPGTWELEVQALRTEIDLETVTADVEIR